MRFEGVLPQLQSIDRIPSMLTSGGELENGLFLDADRARGA